MKTTPLKQSPLHKQFLKCFGTLAWSSCALGYANKTPLYRKVHGTTKRLNRKKLIKGFDDLDKELAKLKKMLDL